MEGRRQRALDSEEFGAAASGVDRRWRPRFCTELQRGSREEDGGCGGGLDFADVAMTQTIWVLEVVLPIYGFLVTKYGS